MTPRLALLVGILVVVAASALWHGPVGNGAARYVAETEELTRANLEHYEMDEITPFIERAPLTRRLWLAGDADSFQRRELARILRGIPAVSDVQWYRARGGSVTGPPLLPLIVEVELTGLVSFGIGMLLAFFLFGRRRERNRFHI